MFHPEYIEAHINGSFSKWKIPLNRLNHGYSLKPMDGFFFNTGTHGILPFQGFPMGNNENPEAPENRT